MKDSPEREDNGDFVQIVIASDKDSYDNDDVLVMSNLEIEESWFMDLY